MKELIIKEREPIGDLGAEELAWPVVLWRGGLQVLNAESAGEGDAGVKIHREVELRNAGDDGQVVAEGMKTNRGRDGRT